MAKNKKLLFFYEGSVNRNTEECRWFYAVPRPNGVQYDVYELNLKEKSYDLVKADDVTFNYNTKKFSVQTDERPLKRKFNSFTVKNTNGTPKGKMYFFENTLGMEVFLAMTTTTEPQKIDFQFRVKDGDRTVPFNDSNSMIFQVARNIMIMKGVKNINEL